MSVPSSYRASATGIKAQPSVLLNRSSSFLPKSIAVIGPPNELYPTEGDPSTRITSSRQAGELYGFGSPLYYVARELFPDDGDYLNGLPVTFYPMWDGIGYDGSDVKVNNLNGDLPLQAETWYIEINNIRSLPIEFDGTEATENDVMTKIVAAINGVIDMPVIAENNSTSVNCSAKWGGSSSNYINSDSYVFIPPEYPSFTLFATNAEFVPSNRSVQPALDAIGEKWEPWIINCMEPEDEENLDRFEAWADSRKDKMPCLIVTGDTNDNVNDILTIPETRKTDRFNAQINVPGTLDFPFQIAARAVAQAALVSDSSPASGYSRKQIKVNSAASPIMWNPSQLDQLMKGGSSTTQYQDNIIYLNDAVTFYHPDGETDPASTLR